MLKKKKYLIALTIFGVSFFYSNATDIIDINDQIEIGVEIKRNRIKIPTNG